MNEDISSLPTNFIKDIINQDNASGKWNGRVHTRFSPEPNGYLHLGHAKSICLNFGLAREYSGMCNLRLDDTNPAKEEQEYVNSICDSMHWLGFTWDEPKHYASDYFQQLYNWAERLIRLDKAYVDDQPANQIRENRGTLTRPGTNSPFRKRSITENLNLFRRMRAGEFPDGARVLRAKIDMYHPNIIMRDPILYRIRHAKHHRTGDAWCIYPMYDYTHCLSDSIEGITHSICTLEFENNRTLYDWVLDTLSLYHPKQIEFARLNLTYTVLSKRRLIQLVEEGHVTGWDDPRLPTLEGVRRRGFTPASLRLFCEKIGVGKADNIVNYSLLEHCLREDLNNKAPRYMAVLRPIKVVLTNYPKGQVEWFKFPNHPEKPELGSRQVPFSRELYIEADDFREIPPRKFHRLFPGQETRLRYAYYIICREVIKNAAGEIVELHCEYDPASRGGGSPDGRRVKGTLHWVAASHAVDAKILCYGQLFTTENPMQVTEGHTFKDTLAPNSIEVLTAKIEPALAAVAPEANVQFERLGYFVADRRNHTPNRPVFNRTVPLKDSWAKIAKAQND
ncbi:glutamine--tRNA ligase [Desulfovibrionales bacterium]